MPGPEFGLKRILIISPHFPPVNAADMQRVRMLLPFFQQNGWQAEVLAVCADQIASSKDDWLLAGMPESIPVHTVRALSLAWSRIPGLGTLAFRAIRALAKAGDRLLSSSHFDLIYFSTTVFPVHALGPRWKKKFAVPFVMDYQDPWVSDYYREHPEITPPGGRLKYAVIDRLSRRAEPTVLKECAGITSVSALYPQQLQRRYPEIRLPPFLVQAFPGAQRDFDRLTATHKLPVFNQSAGLLHWLYVGRGGADMGTALRGLFAAIAALEDSFKKRIKMHFIGTSYAAAGKGQKTVEPIAAEFALQDMVVESPDRMAYSETLQHLMQADALIVPGSNDPAYTASKIYPYLLARRPMLAIFHEKSGVVDLLAEVGGAVCVPFSERDSTGTLAQRISQAWITTQNYERVQPLDESAFLDYSDAGCAKRLTAFFDQLLEQTSLQLSKRN